MYFPEFQRCVNARCFFVVFFFFSNLVFSFGSCRCALAPRVGGEVLFRESSRTLCSGACRLFTLLLCPLRVHGLVVRDWLRKRTWTQLRSGRGYDAVSSRMSSSGSSTEKTKQRQYGERTRNEVETRPRDVAFAFHSGPFHFLEWPLCFLYGCGWLAALDAVGSCPEGRL